MLVTFSIAVRSVDSVAMYSERMTDRRTLLGALWDRQAVEAGSAGTFVRGESPPVPMPPRPASPKTAVRGEGLTNGCETKTRGESPDPITRTRGESSTSRNLETRERGETS